MRYLHQFEAYRRTSKGSYEKKSITEEEFFTLLKENCSQFIDVVKSGFKLKGEDQNKFLYRRFQSNIDSSLKSKWPQFMYVNPSSSEHLRIAPWSESGNWHNIIISNLESWSNFPRRNKSLICAGYQRARSHGGNDMFIVIPYDKTKIGVCPEIDFWESFKESNLQDHYLVDWFSRLVSNLKRLVPNHNFTLDESFDDIKSIMNRTYKDDSIRELFKGDWDPNKTLLENLDKKLDPIRNNFKCTDFTNVSNIINESCKECWFEGEALLILLPLISKQDTRDTRFDEELLNKFLNL